MKKLYILALAIVFGLSINAQQYVVTFQVDATPAIDSGIFVPSADTTDIYIAGSVWGWAQPGTNTGLMLTATGTGNVYEYTCDTVPADSSFFKFFLVHNDVASWDFGEWDGDPNRGADISSDTSLIYLWGVEGILGVQDIASLDVNVYPNPTSDYIYVNYNQGTMSLFDVNGRLVSTTDLSSKRYINVAGLNSGLYFVKVQSSEGYFSKKIIVK